MTDSERAFYRSCKDGDDKDKRKSYINRPADDTSQLDMFTDTQS